MWKFLSDLFEWILDLLGLQKKGSSSSRQTSSENVPVAPIFPTEVTARHETELRLEANVQPQYRKNKSIKRKGK